MFAVFMIFAWIPIALLLAVLLSPRRAAAVLIMVPWLFLPMVAFKLHGLPALSKTSAASIGALLALSLFRPRPLMAFKPSWIDLPMLFWCLVPIGSSASNNLGLYDGLSSSFDTIVNWGIPYLIGRTYLRDLDGMRDLIFVIFAGGLIYVPLCLFEIKMSPQLHRMVYGIGVDDFTQAKRYGGWRPIIFMQHGLMVSMWMAVGSLAGYWLWKSGTIRRIWGIPIGWALTLQVATTILCKSVGAAVLMMVGWAALTLSQTWKTKTLLWCLVVAAPFYMAIRGPGISLAFITEAVYAIDKERGNSLEVRLKNEDDLAAAALEQPLLGWGGWGRGMQYDEEGKATTIADGLWIIWLTRYGLLGLGSFTLIFLIPEVIAVRRTPQLQLASKQSLSPVTLIVILVAISMIDDLMNAMINPLITVAAGALAGYIAQPAPGPSRVERQQAAGPPGNALARSRVGIGIRA